MEAEGAGGGVSKTIVEVYVETDSESDPYSSSEGDDGSEATLTAQEEGLEERPDLNQEPTNERLRLIPSEITPSQLSPPAIMSSSGESFSINFTACYCVYVHTPAHSHTDQQPL